MAKGDGLFARVDVDVWTKPRVMMLRPAGAKAFYIMLWTLAVRERNDILVKAYCKQMSIAFLQTSERTARTHMQKCIEAGLVRDNGDGTVTVVKVRDCHGRMIWGKGFTPPPYGGKKSPRIIPVEGANEDEDEEKEKEVLTNEDDKTQSKRGNERRPGSLDKSENENPLEDTLNKIKRQFTQHAAETSPEKIDEVANDVMLSLHLPERERKDCRVIAGRFGRVHVNEAMMYVRDRIDAARNKTGDPVRNKLALMNWKLNDITGRAPGVDTLK